MDTLGVRDLAIHKVCSCPEDPTIYDLPSSESSDAGCSTVDGSGSESAASDTDEETHAAIRDVHAIIFAHEQARAHALCICGITMQKAFDGNHKPHCRYIDVFLTNLRQRYGLGSDPRILHEGIKQAQFSCKNKCRSDTTEQNGRAALVGHMHCTKVIDPECRDVDPDCKDRMPNLDGLLDDEGAKSRAELGSASKHIISKENNILREPNQISLARRTGLHTKSLKQLRSTKSAEFPKRMTSETPGSKSCSTIQLIRRTKAPEQADETSSAAFHDVDIDKADYDQKMSVPAEGQKGKSATVLKDPVLAGVGAMFTTPCPYPNLGRCQTYPPTKACTGLHRQRRSSSLADDYKEDELKHCDWLVSDNASPPEYSIKVTNLDLELPTIILDDCTISSSPKPIASTTTFPSSTQGASQGIRKRPIDETNHYGDLQQISYGTLHNSASYHSSGGSRKVGGGSDEGGQSDDEDNDLLRPRSRGSVSPVHPRFGCPFKLSHPIENDCGGNGYPSITKLKEHLLRSHRYEIRCRRCWRAFFGRSEPELTGHTIAGTCAAKDQPAKEWIQPYQNQSLHRRFPKGLDEHEKWYMLHDLLLPGVPRPLNPYHQLSLFQGNADMDHSRQTSSLTPSAETSSQPSSNRNVPSLEGSGRASNINSTGSSSGAIQGEPSTPNQMAVVENTAIRDTIDGGGIQFTTALYRPDSSQPEPEDSSMLSAYPDIAQEPMFCNPMDTINPPRPSQPPTAEDILNTARNGLDAIRQEVLRLPPEHTSRLLNVIEEQERALITAVPDLDLSSQTHVTYSTSRFSYEVGFY